MQHGKKVVTTWKKKQNENDSTKKTMWLHEKNRYDNMKKKL